MPPTAAGMCTAGTPFFMGIPRSKDTRRFQDLGLNHVCCSYQKAFYTSSGLTGEKKFSYDTIIALIKEYFCNK